MRIFSYDGVRDNDFSKVVTSGRLKNMLRGNPLGVVKIGENATPALVGEIATPGRSSIKIKCH